MSDGLGNVENVPIKQVFPTEHNHFTPWLAENLDHLSERIGLDLELVGIEVPVGPFKVDLVATVAGTDDLVVVENQFGQTDHDHLGKLLTYAAGQKASYAVWLAEYFRAEHRSALAWANRNSVEGVGYFGLSITAIRIDNSKPAVLLNGVIEPDEWSKQSASSSGSLTRKEQRYVQFWGPLIERIKETYPRWTKKSIPPKDGWITLPAGRTYPWYAIAFGGDRIRIELYVDGPDSAAQQHLWTQLEAARDVIDQALPGLDWQPLENKKASRIALWSPFEATVDDSGQWNSYYDWVIENLGPFRKALQPQIDALESFVPEAGTL